MSKFIFKQTSYVRNAHIQPAKLNLLMCTCLKLEILVSGRVFTSWVIHYISMGQLWYLRWLTAFCFYCVKACKSQALYNNICFILTRFTHWKDGRRKLQKACKRFMAQRCKILEVATDPETMKNLKDSITLCLDVQNEVNVRWNTFHLPFSWSVREGRFEVTQMDMIWTFPKFFPFAPKKLTTFWLH